MKAFFEVASDPVTFVQAALPEIIEKTEEGFFPKVIDVLRQDADIIFEKLKGIPHITCPNKPEGSMFMMVKLNMDILGGIQDDIDFCVKLAKEEKVMVLPGSTLGAKNWLRITFGLEPSILEEALQRIKAFVKGIQGNPCDSNKYQRHCADQAGLRGKRCYFNKEVDSDDYFQLSVECHHLPSTCLFNNLYAFLPSRI